MARGSCGSASGGTTKADIVCAGLDSEKEERPASECEGLLTPRFACRAGAVTAASAFKNVNEARAFKFFSSRWLMLHTQSARPVAGLTAMAAASGRAAIGTVRPGPGGTVVPSP